MGKRSEMVVQYNEHLGLTEWYSSEQALKLKDVFSTGCIKHAQKDSRNFGF